MLHLACSTPARWLPSVLPHLDTVLLDHAHCEKKAASTVISLIFRYQEYPEMMGLLSEVAREELEHFEQVLELLGRRGIRFRALPPSPYAKRLSAHARSTEPEQLLDRLLCCSLIEARSCERMKLLAEGLDELELREFYEGLLVSEARHHHFYVELAQRYFDREVVQRRLQELALAEGEIVAVGSEEPRMHS
jgi:tRNA-(ms[2]io[6]A)-hydroxylase